MSTRAIPPGWFLLGQVVKTIQIITGKKSIEARTTFGARETVMAGQLVA